MSNIERARQALLRRVLEGDGKASLADRRAAFNNGALAEPVQRLVNKVANNPRGITENDFSSARRSGLSEDQIFEIVVCAAIGQASRQYDSAKAALEKAREN